MEKVNNNDYLKTVLTEKKIGPQLKLAGSKQVQKQTKGNSFSHNT